MTVRVVQTEGLLFRITHHLENKNTAQGCALSIRLSNYQVVYYGYSLYDLDTPR